jgi:hypothetical protein
MKHSELLKFFDTKTFISAASKFALVPLPIGRPWTIARYEVAIPQDLIHDSIFSLFFRIFTRIRLVCPRKNAPATTYVTRKCPIPFIFLLSVQSLSLFRTFHELSPEKGRDDIPHMAEDPDLLSLTVVLASGQHHTVEISSYETPRCLLTRLDLSNRPGGRTQFIANRATLQPDLSFARQGIATDTVIHIVYVPQNRARRQLGHPCLRQGSYPERLRLADLAFLPFEIAREHRGYGLVVRAHTRSQMESDLVDAALPTVTEHNSVISEDPLPTGWCECPTGAPPVNPTLSGPRPLPWLVSIVGLYFDD